MLTDPLPGFPVPVNGHFGAPRGVIAGIDYGTHKGLDKTAPAGTPVPAAGAGVVTHSVGAFTPDPHMGGGNHVFVDHGGGLETRYYHLLARYVVKGQAVTPATIIGSVGATGTATGNHLHLEVVDKGQHVDPAPLIGLGGAAGRVPLVDRAGGQPATPAGPSVIPMPSSGQCPSGYVPGMFTTAGVLFDLADPAQANVCARRVESIAGEVAGAISEAAMAQLLNVGVLLAAIVLIAAGAKKALGG